jgi:hypothetical protein
VSPEEDPLDAGAHRTPPRTTLSLRVDRIRIACTFRVSPGRTAWVRRTGGSTQPVGYGNRRAQRHYLEVGHQAAPRERRTPRRHRGFMLQLVESIRRHTSVAWSLPTASGALLLVGLGPVVVGGCASRASTEVAATPATAAPAPSLDPFRWTHPSAGWLIAAGTARSYLPVGHWEYFYPDGSTMACGSYDSNGQCEGPWLLWQPDGALDRSNEGTLQCVDTRLGIYRPGAAEFQRNVKRSLLSSDQRMLVPFLQDDWQGVGFYRKGVWMRALTASEEAQAMGDCGRALGSR